MKKAVFFDLDHTLFKTNSSYSFGKYLYNAQQIPLLKFIYLLSCYFHHKVFHSSLSDLHHRVFKEYFQGKSKEWIQKHIQTFLDEALPGMLNPVIYTHLQKAQNEQCFTALVSNSPDFLVQPIAERLGFKEWLGSQYAFDSEEKLSALTKLVEGETKAEYVKDISIKHGIPFEKMVAYTDSFLDIPLLLSVGKPICVNPDRHLAQLAHEKHWEIIE